MSPPHEGLTDAELDAIRAELESGGYDIPGDGSTKRDIAALLAEVDRLRERCLVLGAGSTIAQVQIGEPLRFESKPGDFELDSEDR